MYVFKQYVTTRWLKYAAGEIWRASPISTDWLLAECAVSNVR